MIDWTDRSQDVLARFEAWRNSPNKTAEQIAHADILMADLATMVDQLADHLLSAKHGLGQKWTKQDLLAMVRKTARDETGARLFPNPAEE